MAKCPECAEMVADDARKCRYCGYYIDARADPAWQRNLLYVILMVIGLFAFVNWVASEEGIETIVALEQIGGDGNEGQRDNDYPTDLDENGCSPALAASAGSKCPE